MEAIVTPVIVLSVMGGVFAFLLGIVSKLTYIPVDEKQLAVREALPGANCGACGYPGCDGCAKAIAMGEAPVTACPVGGKSVAEAIAAIMGQVAQEGTRYVASVKCQGTHAYTKQIFDYAGVNDCRMMDKFYGGCKSCVYGCLGCGTCKKVCNYDAIRMEDGVAVINEEKCVSCMACINVCPKHIIELVPYQAPAQVKCKNPKFGKDVKSNCGIGCIGCGICARLAPNEFQLDGKLAHAVYSDTFDVEKAKQAAAKCPAKCIVIHKSLQDAPEVQVQQPVEA